MIKKINKNFYFSLLVYFTLFFLRKMIKIRDLLLRPPNIDSFTLFFVYFVIICHKTLFLLIKVDQSVKLKVKK